MGTQVTTMDDGGRSHTGVVAPGREPDTQTTIDASGSDGLSSAGTDTSGGPVPDSVQERPVEPSYCRRTRRPSATVAARGQRQLDWADQLDWGEGVDAFEVEDRGCSFWAFRRRLASHGIIVDDRGDVEAEVLPGNRFIVHERLTATARRDGDGDVILWLLDEYDAFTEDLLALSADERSILRKVLSVEWPPGAWRAHRFSRTHEEILAARTGDGACDVDLLQLAVEIFGRCARTSTPWFGNAVEAARKIGRRVS